MKPQTFVRFEYPRPMRLVCVGVRLCPHACLADRRVEPRGSANGQFAKESAALQTEESHSKVMINARALKQDLRQDYRATLQQSPSRKIRSSSVRERASFRGPHVTHCLTNFIFEGHETPKGRLST